MSESNTLEKAAIAAILASALPPLGQPLEGGTFCGITTTPDGTHCAVVLLADKPSGPLTWKDACAWTASVGGELPSRPAAALLFATAREHFERRWHWTSDSEGSGAWVQYFTGGLGWYGQGSELLARAVRMIPLTL